MLFPQFFGTFFDDVPILDGFWMFSAFLPSAKNSPFPPTTDCGMAQERLHRILPADAELQLGLTLSEFSPKFVQSAEAEERTQN